VKKGSARGVSRPFLLSCSAWGARVSIRFVSSDGRAKRQGDLGAVQVDRRPNQDALQRLLGSSVGAGGAAGTHEAGLREHAVGVDKHAYLHRPRGQVDARVLEAAVGLDASRVDERLQFAWGRRLDAAQGLGVALARSNLIESDLATGRLWRPWPPRSIPSWPTSWRGAPKIVSSHGTSPCATG
jgi:hypothetical protein